LNYEAIFFAANICNTNQ